MLSTLIVGVLQEFGTDFLQRPLTQSGSFRFWAEWIGSISLEESSLGDCLTPGSASLGHCRKPGSASTRRPLSPTDGTPLLKGSSKFAQFAAGRTVLKGGPCRQTHVQVVLTHTTSSKRSLTAVPNIFPHAPVHLLPWTHALACPFLAAPPTLPETLPIPLPIPLPIASLLPTSSLLLSSLHGKCLFPFP